MKQASKIIDNAERTANNDKHSKEKVKQRAALHHDKKRQEAAVKYWRASPFLAQGYLYFCYHMWLIQKSNIWNNYILICIIVAGLLVGVQTYSGMDSNPTVAGLDQLVLYSFAVEILLKIFSEGLSPYWFFLIRTPNLVFVEWRRQVIFLV